jgi:hypothetical protein
MRTIKESCLDHLVLFGEASLPKAVWEFIGHYHSERNHQGRDVMWPEKSRRSYG